jgi:O-acetyl-ADP-ribose deacetylase (regulator of RNase III)
MITYTTGNLLEAPAEVLVNTVNTVGVMGKGIALMFKERFPENFQAYKADCDSGDVKVGKMHITMPMELSGPKWIVNFPTKQHWRRPTELEWVQAGLADLRTFIEREKVKSIALPPLGCGNGGLDWEVVKEEIVSHLSELPDTEVMIYEPTKQYQNMAKKQGVEKLTLPRALSYELIRRYWVLGIDCTLLEVQKLVYFLDKKLKQRDNAQLFNLEFKADLYGPHARNLYHLLNSLDGSYLTSEKRIPDCSPTDTIGIRYDKKEKVQTFLRGECDECTDALNETDRLIDGFQSPLGLEALATVDWLISEEGVHPSLSAIREGLSQWKGGAGAGARKLRLFDDKLIKLCIERLAS